MIHSNTKDAQTREVELRQRLRSVRVRHKCTLTVEGGFRSCHTNHRGMHIDISDLFQTYQQPRSTNLHTRRSSWHDGERKKAIISGFQTVGEVWTGPEQISTQPTRRDSGRSNTHSTQLTCLFPSTFLLFELFLGSLLFTSRVKSF